MDVRHARVEQAVEALDQADDFDLELVGARDRAVNGGVERGRVAAGGEDADAFHRSRILRDCCCCSSCCTMCSLFRILKRLENIGVEQRLADVVQLASAASSRY